MRQPILLKGSKWMSENHPEGRGGHDTSKGRGSGRRSSDVTWQKFRDKLVMVAFISPACSHFWLWPEGHQLTQWGHLKSRPLPKSAFSSGLVSRIRLTDGSGKSGEPSLLTVRGSAHLTSQTWDGTFFKVRLPVPLTSYVLLSSFMGFACHFCIFWSWPIMHILADSLVWFLKARFIFGVSIAGQFFQLSLLVFSPQTVCQQCSAHWSI